MGVALRAALIDGGGTRGKKEGRHKTRHGGKKEERKGGRRRKGTWRRAMDEVSPLPLIYLLTLLPPRRHDRPWW